MMYRYKCLKCNREKTVNLDKKKHVNSTVTCNGCHGKNLWGYPVIKCELPDCNNYDDPVIMPLLDDLRVCSHCFDKDLANITKEVDESSQEIQGWQV